ncbi:hypothetical protein L873DRAFT_1819736 [Choiromyces venosus 120613-1]|uniref:Uncharacterized protein n=1 Tax=Choiromyces venosus 120613-1 TaxID=1336337 RepID=A0A3N4IZF5_9PEZI|nr:hypothetical protein L873DRAFT_1819736 [Choiromyces venosus 120613-1]
MIGAREEKKTPRLGIKLERKDRFAIHTEKIYRKKGKEKKKGKKKKERKKETRRRWYSH